MRSLETPWHYLRFRRVVSVREGCKGSRLHGPSRDKVHRGSLALLEISQSCIGLRELKGLHGPSRDEVHRGSLALLKVLVLSSPYQPSNQLAKTPVFALLVVLKGSGGCIVLLLDRVTKQRHLDL